MFFYCRTHENHHVEAKTSEKCADVDKQTFTNTYTTNVVVDGNLIWDAALKEMFAAIPRIPGPRIKRKNKQVSFNITSELNNYMYNVNFV